jgi:hypothetical protein
MIEAVLHHTKPQDAIFDGNAAYVFRRQAYYYGSLVEGIRERIVRGEKLRSIEQSLIDSQCKWILYDDRVARLPEKIQHFIRENYIPSFMPNVYVAGKILGAESFSGNQAIFKIAIPAIYAIQVNQEQDFEIDGNRYQSPVFLERGKHTISSQNGLFKVILRADKSDY